MSSNDSLSSTTTATATITTITTTTTTIYPISITDQSTPVTSVIAEGVLLAALTSQQQKVNMVVVGVLVLVIVVGLVGNVLVLAAYRPRSGAVPASSPAILFIVVMAGLDVATCVMSLPYEILDLMKPYSNDNIPLCQAARFVTTLLSQSRGLMLLCVAWDRYIKICLPLTSYTYHQAKAVVLVVFTLALVFSWPQVPLNGLVTITTHVPHVLATDCNIVRHLPAIYSLLYHGVLYLLFVVFFVMYGILYGRIFYVLWRNGWFECSAMSSSSSSSAGTCRQVESEAGVTRATPRAVRHSVKNGKGLQVSQQGQNEGDCARASSHVRPSSERCGPGFHRQGRRSERDMNSHHLDVCGGMQDSSVVSCTSAVRNQEKDGLFSVRVEASGDERGEEQSSLGRNWTAAPLKRKCSDGVTCDSGARQRRMSLLSHLHTSRQSTADCDVKLGDDPSADGFLRRHQRQSSKGGNFTFLPLTHWRALTVGKSKERHPKSLYRCQQLTAGRISEGGTVGGRQRSQSVPCWGTADVSRSPPLLLTRCSASIQTAGSVISDVSAHSAHTGSDVRGEVSALDTMPAIRGDLSTTCCFSLADQVTSPPSPDTKNQRSWDQSPVSLDDGIALTRTCNSYETAELDNFAEFLKDITESGGTCLSCSTRKSSHDVDITRENNGADDNNHAGHLPCISMSRAEELNLVREKDAPERSLLHRVTESNLSRISMPCKRHRYQLSEAADADTRAGRSSDVTFAEMYSHQHLCKDENTTQNQNHFHSLERSKEDCQTGHKNNTQGFVHDDKVRLLMDPKDLQIEEVKHITLYEAADPKQGHLSESPNLHFRQDLMPNGTSPVTGECSRPTFITTKDMPTGAASVAVTLPREASTTPTLDRRAGKTCHGGMIRRHGGKRLRMGKTTLMLAVVTLSTVLCFVPFLTVIVMRTSGLSFQNQTSSTGDLAYMFCVRSFFLNNLLNPFVYFYVNPRFRHKVRDLFCRAGRGLLHLKSHSPQSEMSVAKTDTR